MLDANGQELTGKKLDLAIIEYMRANPKLSESYYQSYRRAASAVIKEHESKREPKSYAALPSGPKMSEFMTAVKTAMSQTGADFIASCIVAAAHLGGDFLKELGGEFLSEKAGPAPTPESADAYRAKLGTIVKAYPAASRLWQYGLHSEQTFLEMFSKNPPSEYV